MSTARAWILAARPATLPAALAPVSVGMACAAAVGSFRAAPALAALFGALAIQIGTNFANDVFDFEKGADDERRLGPTRAVQAGLLSPAAMRAATGLAFVLAAAAGLYLVAVAGWPVVVIGLVSILAGLGYTAGPYPLGYHGLGDLCVLVFFGFVAVCGTVYVQSGSVPPLALASSVPVGALATAILVVNNLRDRNTDAGAGKRTLAVRFGRRFAACEYAALLGAAYLTPVALAAAGAAPFAVLLPLLTLPLGVSLARRVASLEGKALNLCLRDTARLLLAFAALFCAGLILG